jgi:hypothetical protein
MPLSGSGDLSNDGLDNALNSIDFWSASSINPRQMTNDCVSVSLAVQNYYRDTYNTWQTLYSQPPPDVGLTFSQIKSHL